VEPKKEWVSGRPGEDFPDSFESRLSAAPDKEAFWREESAKSMAEVAARVAARSVSK
jgi:hypothetical protein